MLKVTNIKKENNLIKCIITGDDYSMSFEVSVNNWNNMRFSEQYYKIDACHVRNKLKSLYFENNGKLPKEFTLIFG